MICPSTIFSQNTDNLHSMTLQSFKLRVWGQSNINWPSSHRKITNYRKSILPLPHLSLLSVLNYVYAKIQNSIYSITNMHIKDIKYNYQALHFIQNPAWLRMSSSSISIRPFRIGTAS